MEAAFTNKEFRELLGVSGCVVKVNEAELECSLDELQIRAASNRTKSRGLPLLQKCVANFSDRQLLRNEIRIRFNQGPVEYATTNHTITGLVVRDSKITSKETVTSNLAIESVGFKVSNTFGFPLDPKSGGILHDGRGKVADGVFVAGWAKRGPRGVIAANIPDSAETAHAMFDDLIAGKDRIQTEVFPELAHRLPFLPSLENPLS